MLSKKFFILNVSNIINLLSLFLLQYLISKYLSEKSFSEFTAILGLCFMLLPLINFGISPYIIKNYFKKSEYKDDTLRNIFNYLNFTSIFILLIFFLFSRYILNIDSPILIIVFGIHLISNVFFEILYSKFQYKYNYFKILFLIICFNFSKLFLIITFLYLRGSIDLNLVAYIYLISSIIVIILYYFNFRDIINKIKIFEFKTFLNSIIIIKDTFPFGINGIVFYLYYFCDLVIIYKFGSDKTYAGNFSLSLSFIFLLYLIPTITIDKFYINQFYTLFNNRKFIELKKLTNNMQYLFTGYALLVIFLTILFINDIIIILYEEKYHILSDLILIMSFSIFFRYSTIVLNGIVHAGSYLLYCSSFWFVLTIVKVITNIYIVSYFNIIYVAYSFVLFEILVFIIFYIFNHLTINNEK